MIYPDEANPTSGDDDAKAVEFMELLTPRQSRIFAYVFALVSNATDAYDVYQQTVMSMWKKFDTRDASRDFTGWALTTARFEVLAYRRSKARSKIRFSDELLEKIAGSQWVEPGDSFDTDDALEGLRECLGRLKPSDLNLINRCYHDRSPIKRVAEGLGRSSQSVSNSLRRIRRLLLQCVDRHKGLA